jgi:hypothetical protein
LPSGQKTALPIIAPLGIALEKNSFSTVSLGGEKRKNIEDRSIAYWLPDSLHLCSANEKRILLVGSKMEQITVIERRRSCLFSMQVTVKYVTVPIIGVIREKNTNVQNAVKKLVV